MFDRNHQTKTRPILPVKFFLCLGVVVLWGIVLTASAEETPTESFPLEIAPRQLVNELNEPLRSMKIAMADTLAEKQAELLDERQGSSANPLDSFVLGFAYAAEEYFQRELSYPKSLSDLYESGYFLPGWNGFGIPLVDYKSADKESVELQLVYVPQPIGLVDLVCTPQRGCTELMRSHKEYSLAIKTDLLTEVFENPPKIRTSWFRVFYERGYSEILHISNDNTATSVGAY